MTSKLKQIHELPPLSDPLESAKRVAAYKAVDENFPHEATGEVVVGIGSGSTVVYAAERIGQLPNKANFVCIPTGFQSQQLIIDNGMKLGRIEQYPEIEIAFDGADEVDYQLNLIKGGGACLFQEKLVASSSKKFIVVADFRKKSPKHLGVAWKKGVPIEVVPVSYARVLKDLYKLGAVKAIVRQGGSAKAGPVVTDNNNFLIDADFGEISNPQKLHNDIKGLVGVVETGLFVNGIANKAYFGESNGEFTTQE
ncbi:ribose-5-phosphate isomerase [Saccharomycopsis crataegensis]|uniref:Ribose-5-phosphate isomerase n=1 Tax=Saccharomycopsis crataegensis TaxID=43959 RepID=A0AAV5QLA4_9ASCO|nr:ribose-5-phosphate isomerase [Saccharomycopsis crataegensis]